MLGNRMTKVTNTIIGFSFVLLGASIGTILALCVVLSQIPPVDRSELETQAILPYLTSEIESTDNFGLVTTYNPQLATSLDGKVLR